MLLATKHKFMETNSTSSFQRSRRNTALRWLVMAALSTFWLPAWAGPAPGELSSRFATFATLQQRLIMDGFDMSMVQTIYSRPEVTFDQQGIAAYFSHREATLNYDNFLTQSSIDQAIEYLKEHGRALGQAEKRYGVEREVVTAILLVESRVGTFIGKRRVLNTLSSLAALDEVAKREMLWNTHLKKNTTESKNDFIRWAIRKSAWSYRELKAYLKYVTAQNTDPFSVRGSYAGALGFAQFVPSSVLEFGQDGNNDGYINMFHHMDAIESVANYLKKHGWRPGMRPDEAFRILLCYNHSKYYADTIIKVAERLSLPGVKCKPNKAEVSQ